jgi:hypothetical protein
MIPKELNRKNVASLKERLRRLNEMDPLTWTNEDRVDLILGPPLVQKHEAFERDRLANRKPLAWRVATVVIYGALAIAGFIVLGAAARGLVSSIQFLDGPSGLVALACGVLALVVWYVRGRS